MENKINNKLKLDNFLWINKPSNIKIDNNNVRIVSSANSDFYRNYSNNRKSGNLLYNNIKGNFKVSTTLTGEWKEEYDQGGLFIGNLTEDKWIKTGIEFINDKEYISTVVTNPFSDWTVTPIIVKYINKIYIEIERNNLQIIIRYSFNDEPLMFFRKINVFMKEMELQVGLYVASPKNKNGVNVNFKDFNIINI
jgi:regulation of enolase protein 1 (concanavalin A-like superfamily)